MKWPNVPLKRPSQRSSRKEFVRSKEMSPKTPQDFRRKGLIVPMRKYAFVNLVAEEPCPFPLEERANFRASENPADLLQLKKGIWATGAVRAEWKAVPGGFRSSIPAESGGWRRT